MKPFVTCAQMKLLEKLADESGLSYYQMMENAGIRAVKAQYTITFHNKKPVHLQDFAVEYCGEVLIADIGIDEDCFEI